MIKFFKTLCIASILFASSVQANKVTKVYSCGNDIGIEVENVGWYVIRESQVGEKRVDRMMSIALSLLATQANIGFVDPKESIQWCGIANAKPITVLQATRL